jgi:hypothetical protein
MGLTAEQRRILEEARERAGNLVRELEGKAAELEKNPPKVEAGQLEEGREAMRKAIAAVKKALENIEKAAEVADKTSELGGK